MKINQKAAVVQAKEIVINAKAEKVWEILSDIDNWETWNHKIKHARVIGDSKAGSSFIWTTNGTKIKSKIHTYLPNEKLGWTGNTLGARAIHNWLFTPTGNGTKVCVEESMEGWIIDLMKNKMNKKLAEDMVYWLEQLKKECEK
ncbi:SRPBCC family protein [Marinilongibacter aquaticus]|uniref:SRPBCC family protein n=1 Tax=Marinilongibacter aquaticus TaxID=2975157 RepID=UPI0021BDE6B5|nr:SRPBCC family protein [Marinilongibacter aquaticus]UBM59486.1 SRPBCC family protein [Marinilongibacter aquaticus]